MNGIGSSAIIGATYLAASVAVFVFGSSYYSLLRTNRSWIYRAALPIAASLAVWLCFQFSLTEMVRLLSIGFLAATTANFAGWAVAWLQRPLRISDDSMRGIALLKLLEALAVVGAILLVLSVTQTPLSMAFLVKGKLGIGLAVGLGGFALFAIVAVLQARSLKRPTSKLLRLLPWILTFVFANAFMEELWFRGLFLGPLTGLVGSIAAAVLTAAVFALAHIGAVYLSKEDRIRFLAILFPLGIGWALCIQYTASLVASTLIHAGADLIIVHGLLGSLGDRSTDGTNAS